MTGTSVMTDKKDTIVKTVGNETDTENTKGHTSESPLVTFPTYGDSIPTSGEVRSTFSVAKGHLWYAFKSDSLIPGATKIGDTTRDVPTRLDEWQRSDFPDLEMVATGDLEVLPGVYVRDHALHKGIVNKGHHQLQAEDFTDGIQHTTEAYDVNPDDAPELIPDIITDIRAKHGSPTAPYTYYSVEEDKKEVGVTRYPRDPFDWDLRPMQEATVNAIEEAVANGIDEMLVDASVRFGKTFTALSAAQRLGAKRILVASGKADVMNEWRKAVDMPGQFKGWDFVSPDMLRASDDILTEIEKDANVIVGFMTLQDGRNADEKSRYDQVLSRKWDVLLVDETHFGTRAPEFHHAIELINRDVTIHLSGTPYRILMTNEFSPDQIVACYTRTDMLEARDAWFDENADAIEAGETQPWKNPYFGLPTPVTFALRGNEESMAKIEALSNDDATVNLDELFRADLDDTDGKPAFNHEDEVRLFLRMLDGEDEKMGFLSFDIAERNDLFRHMLCALPRKRSCDALEALIHTMVDEGELTRFEDYEIVNVAGETEEAEARNATKAVDEIAALAKDGRLTLTLTVNMMLTGVTVPEWDTFLMLRNMGSPEQYEQATGRLLSAYVETVRSESDPTDSYKINRKPYVVVIDPDVRRVFRIAEQRSIAQRITGQGIDEAVERDVAYAPIITANEDGFKKVTPTELRKEISRYASQGIADEVDTIPVDPTMFTDWDFMVAIRDFDAGADSGKRRQIEVDPFLEDGDELDIPDVDKLDEDGMTADASDVSDDNDGNISDYEEDASPVDDGDDAKAREAVKKKVRDFYFRMLAFSAAWQGKGLVKTVEDIRIRARTTATGREIAANLGILEDINTLCDTVDKFPNIKFRLDNAIYNISTLVNDPELTGMEKAKTLMERFGRLSSSEVATPLWVAEKMVDSIPETAFGKDMPRFLDLASKVGEMAYALVERCGRIEAETGRKLMPEIRSVTTSPIAYVLCVAVYRLLGLDYRQVAKFTSYDLLGKDIKTMAKTLRQDKDFYQIDLFDLVGGQADEKADEVEEQPVDGTDDGTTDETGLLEFDAVVSNPPYQSDNASKGQNRSKPVYHCFMDLGYAISDVAIFITPGRFLSNTGFTPKEWNRKVLSDRHLDVAQYWIKSTDAFSDVDIKGGVAITRRNMATEHEPIGIFIPFTELRSITKKVTASEDFSPLSDVVTSQAVYKLSDEPYKDFPHLRGVQPSGDSSFRSNVFSLLPDLFFDTCPTTGNYIRVLGRDNGHRAWKWMKRSYLVTPSSFDNWKVIIPKSNGSGAIGEVLSTPLVGEPLVGYTATFLGIGSFATEYEANACLKYIKTRFCRAMLGTLKTTQDNPARTWVNVPLQDFTSDSDIDWSKSIDEIDEQLFDKYGLTDEEREFIKEKVQKMD